MRAWILSNKKRFEQKFRMYDEVLTRALLDRLFQRDEEYPENIIYTLYYDTKKLDMFEEKECGQLNKHKLRIRWYYDGFTKKSPERFYIEHKMKRDNGGLKSRLTVDEKLPVDDEGTLVHLSNLHFSFNVKRFFNDIDWYGPSDVSPAILIAYRRTRYIDPLSNSRISLDSDITVVDFNRDLFFSSKYPGFTLQDSVLEVKNNSGEIPQLLAQFSHMQHCGFSKYALGINALIGDEPHSLLNSHQLFFNNI